MFVKPNYLPTSKRHFNATRNRSRILLRPTTSTIHVTQTFDTSQYKIVPP